MDADRANQLKSFIHETSSLSHRQSSVLSYIRIVKIELLPSPNGTPQLGNTHCIAHAIRQLCDLESLPVPSVHVSLAKLNSGPESCIALSTFPLVNDIVTHVRLADASFADGNDIWPFLSSFPRLQSLELAKVGFDDYSRPALPSERIFDGIPLSKLRITTAFMGFIISSLIAIADSLNHLEDFGVTYQDIRQARLPQLAEVIQGRVKRLRFNASCYPGPRRSTEIRPSTFNTQVPTFVHQFRSLDTLVLDDLRVDCSGSTHYDIFDVSFDWIPAVLQRLSSPIRKLVFEVIASYPPQLGMIPWELIDEIVNPEAPQFKELNQVEVLVRCRVLRGGPLPSIGRDVVHSEITRRLPTLDRLDLLRCDTVEY